MKIFKLMYNYQMETETKRGGYQRFNDSLSIEKEFKFIIRHSSWFIRGCERMRKPEEGDYLEEVEEGLQPLLWGLRDHWKKVQMKKELPSEEGQELGQWDEKREQKRVFSK